MFIRTAQNGQPFFNRLPQTFTIDPLDFDQVRANAAVTSQLNLAALVTVGADVSVVNTISIEATADFVDESYELEPEYKHNSVHEDAVIAALFLDGAEPSFAILHLGNPYHLEHAYYLLVERDSLHSRWTINETVVVVYEGSDEEFDNDVLSGIVDPGLPGWQGHVGIDLFSQLPLHERLAYFAPQPVRA